MYKHFNLIFMESCPSWSKEHDWKSCKPLKRLRGFESLALRQEKAVLLYCFFVSSEIGIRTLRGWGAWRKQSCGLFLATKREAGTVATQRSPRAVDAKQTHPLLSARKKQYFCTAFLLNKKRQETWASSLWFLSDYFLSPFFSYPNVDAKRSILNALITELKSLEPWTGISLLKRPIALPSKPTTI